MLIPYSCYALLKSHDLRLEGSRSFFLVGHLPSPPLLHLIPLHLEGPNPVELAEFKRASLNILFFSESSTLSRPSCFSLRSIWTSLLIRSLRLNVRQQGGHERFLKICKAETLGDAGNRRAYLKGQSKR